MRRETLIQVIAGVCMVVFLAASAVLGTQIAASTGRHRLVYADSAESGDPPAVALGIAMGAFRGLFVNYLWIRANDLKEAGKYYEAVDLAKNITRLQPRFPKVWQFHAWNLAYNISVVTQTPQERWNWVMSGIRLLRNEGIPNCPNDLGIHRELAWIHQHKIQGNMDDAHLYYKKQFALEWSYVLGAPPQPRLDQIGIGVMKQEYIDRWLRPIADAPSSLEEFYAKYPDAPILVQKIKDRAGLDLNFVFLREFELVDQVLAGAQATGVFPNALQQNPLAQIMADPGVKAETGKALISFVRRKVLTEDYHMEPDRMIRYTERYGPLDWRHPSAHAVYWSARGVEETLIRVNEDNKKDFDILNTDRITIQAIQELFRSGQLTFSVLNPEFYLGLPNVEFIDQYRNAMRDMVERSKYEQDRQRPWRFYWAGYENFMRDAIRYVYRRGDIDYAKKLQKALYTDPEINVANPDLYRDLAQPIDDFVKSEILNDNRQDSPVVALQEVSGSLYNAYLGGLLIGNQTIFESSMEYARIFHAQYQETKAFKTWISGPQGRMGFPDFDRWAAEIFAQLISGTGIPNGPTMYRRAPRELQSRTYVYLERMPIRISIDGAAQQGMPAFDVWFPPPNDVDRFRNEYFPNDPDGSKGRNQLK